MTLFLLSVPARKTMFLCLLILFLCSACTPRHGMQKHGSATTQATELRTDGGSGESLRADPGYVQWLEKQSILGSAIKASAFVSGTELGWKYPDEPLHTSPLLAGSALWIELSAQPQHAINKKRLTYPNTPNLKARSQKETTTPLPAHRLSDFSQSQFIATLTQSDIAGLYIADIAESGAIWGYLHDDSLAGRDVTSYAIDSTIGTERELIHLREKLISHGIMLGGDCLPAATGLGPDFFLAARGVRQYPGIYYMVEILPEDWSLLPTVSNQWKGEALTHTQLIALINRGILPQHMTPHQKSENPAMGWAATGKIRGIDGATRRWIYRYANSPSTPALNWDDPSKAAQCMIAGSIINQVGFRQLPLVGLHMQAFAPFRTVEGKTPQPLIEAIESTARQTRRYGGSSWLKDEVSIEQMQQLMPYGTDSITTPLGRIALQVFNEGQHSTSQGQQNQTHSPNQVATKQERLTTQQGLTVNKRTSGERGKQNFPQYAMPARQLHHYIDNLLHNQINLQRLAYTLPLPPEISADALLMLSAIPGIVIFTPEKPQQLSAEAHRIRQLAAMRKQTSVAQGKLLQRLATSHELTLALWIKLPQAKGYLLTISNTASEPLVETISLPHAAFANAHAQEHHLRVKDITPALSNKQQRNAEPSLMQNNQMPQQRYDIALDIEPKQTRIIHIIPEGTP